MRGTWILAAVLATRCHGSAKRTYMSGGLLLKGAGAALTHRYVDVNPR